MDKLGLPKNFADLNLEFPRDLPEFWDKVKSAILHMHPDDQKKLGLKFDRLHGEALAAHKFGKAFVRIGGM